ncbi:hypothetical protein CPB84DRAFT_1708390 [Gymnopilus junonius]|uniref:NAD(P)-binding protein n=1 Tax=Gymnopilus junonius TaxID=109634 RepID=A0A9P5TPB4_GYMJU|nr:hypothetical protein CPB84DRAFT_1708390 [Gymnopilus junonius]
MAPQQRKELIWLITGTSSGLGHSLALQALARQDKVIATSRSVSESSNINPNPKLEELKARGAHILEMDVTSPLAYLREKAKEAADVFGRVDVLVNNAGYILFGTLEENTPEETYDQFNTNFFGALNVTRAFLPYMRERKTGTVIWVGSMFGLVGCPYAGIYTATKWALRGTSFSLHDEISPIGLRSLVVDFGFFRTSVLDPNKRDMKGSKIEDYHPIVKQMEDVVHQMAGTQPGDPIKGAQAILDVVRGEGQAKGKPFPMELVLGTDCFGTATKEAERHANELEVWKDISCGTDFDQED